MSYAAEATTATNQATYVDINDLNLFEEPIEGFDPAADPFAGPPPIPDGRYRVKVRYASDDPSRRWEKRTTSSGTSYYKTRIYAEIVDGEFEGRRAYDDFVSTMLLGSSRSSRAAGIARALGFTPDTPTASGVVKALDAAINSEAICVAELAWRVREYDKETGTEFKLVGMRRFPEDSNGNKTPYVTNPNTGETVKADAYPVAFFPLP